MNAHERYEENEGLVYFTVNRVLYPSAERAAKIAKNNGFELDDFDQIARMALWNCCLKFNGEEKAFSSYAVESIKYAILTAIRRKSSVIKYGDDIKERAELSSIDNTVFNGSDKSIHELLPDNTNVEKYVMKKMLLEERLSVLNEDEKKLIACKLEGITTKQIEDRHGFNKPRQDYLKKTALKKLGIKPEERGKKNVIFIKMYKEGKSKKEIMERLNFGQNSYHLYKRKYIEEAK